MCSFGMHCIIVFLLLCLCVCLFGYPLICVVEDDLQLRRGNCNAVIFVSLVSYVIIRCVLIRTDTWVATCGYG